MKMSDLEADCGSMVRHNPVERLLFDDFLSNPFKGLLIGRGDMRLIRPLAADAQELERFRRLLAEEVAGLSKRVEDGEDCKGGDGEGPSRTMSGQAVVVGPSASGNSSSSGALPW